jgi:hypothetical protein
VRARGGIAARGREGVQRATDAGADREPANPPSKNDPTLWPVEQGRRERDVSAALLPLIAYIWPEPDGDPLPDGDPPPDGEPELLVPPGWLPGVMPLEPIPPLPMLPELPPADPTSNECPCCAACRLCWFRSSIAWFCEVSVPPERDERAACADVRSILCEPVFSDRAVCLAPDVPLLAACDRLALVEFIPVVEAPPWFVPAVEFVAAFDPVLVPPLFIPVVDVVVPAVGFVGLFAPVFALPELFMPVVELSELFVPVVAPDEPGALLVVLVAPVGLFWLPVAEFIAGVEADELPPVVASAAMAGAAPSKPNAQTEASRRPLSMFYSLPVPLPKRSAPHGMRRQRRTTTGRNVGKARAPCASHPVARQRCPSVVTALIGFA